MKLCLIRNEIADLNAEPVLKNYSLSQLKRVTDILIIDDDPFTYEDALKKNEFMIDYKIFNRSRKLKPIASFFAILWVLVNSSKVSTKEHISFSRLRENTHTKR